MLNALVRGLALALLTAGPMAAQQDDHMDDHDHIEDCPPFAWGGFIDPGEQDYTQEVVAGFDDGRIILEVRFGALKDPVAKHFMFLELIDGCVLRALSVGSYMNAVLLSGADTVHVDLYEADTHSTLEMRKSLPDIDAIREQALSIFLDLDGPLPPSGAAQE